MSFHPQTPQSPSHSPNTSDLTTSQPGSVATGTTTTLPTPAHSVNGGSLLSEMAQDTIMGGDSPHKRKRDVSDIGDRAQKKAHIENRMLGITDLHLDVGEKYLLCRTQHLPPPRPRVSEDLFEIYHLKELAGEVARVLPNGEKNALRKTYKGHIKRLGVQGHFDEVKQDPFREDGLLALMKMPQDVWDVHVTRGRNIHDGFSAEVKQKLPKAMSMAKGYVPRAVWDYSVLGDLAPGKGDNRASSVRQTAPNTPLPALGTQGFPRPKVSTPFPQNQVKRNMKKRGFGEEGYGEGTGDDETGYSTGEGDMASGLKRRKKAHPVNQPYAQSQARQPLYGSGTTGS